MKYKGEQSKWNPKNEKQTKTWSNQREIEDKEGK